MATVKIPKITHEEIDADEFRRAARKFRPSSAPVFAIDDIVTVTRDFGRVVPGVVIGCDARIGGWSYQVVTPRADGVLENLQFAEDKIRRS
jgi:hypothetical protein